jgi:hypothetical protein
VGHICIFHP